MIVKLLLSICLLMTVQLQKCDISPIEINFDRIPQEISPKLKFETDYKNLFGLPIDYDS